MTDSEQRTLKEKQTWYPKNGEPLRQIYEIRAAGLGAKRPMGSILVCWATHAGRRGTCSEKAFKRWIKQTEARLHV